MEDKKDKKFWQSWMTIAILLAIVIMVAWSNFRGPIVQPEKNILTGVEAHVPIGNDANVQTGNGDDVKTTRSIGTQAENSTVVPMDNDTFFRTWVGLSFNAISANLDCLYKAGGVRNIIGVEACGKLLADNANASLTHMNDYINVSISMQAASDEYKKALEDYSIGGTNIVIGAKNQNDVQMSDAIGYIQNGTAHVKLVDKMLSGNNTTGEKFVHPQTGANTTGY
jgi:hypothetical protein